MVQDEDRYEVNLDASILVIGRKPAGMEKTHAFAGEFEIREIPGGHLVRTLQLDVKP
jgi:hypothetical protein